MKKVWIISQESSLPSYSSGSGLRHYYLSQGLIEKNYDVELIMAKNHHLMRDVPKITPSDVKVRFIQTFKYNNANSKIRILNWIIFSINIFMLSPFLFRKNDIIIYSSPPPIAILPLLMVRFIKGYKVIFEVRDIWPLSLIEIGKYGKNNLIIGLLSILERYAYKSSDYIISNLKFLDHHAKNIYTDISNKFSWVPNGKVISSKDNKLDKKQRINNSSLRVIYAGTVGVANNIDILMDAGMMLRYDDKISITVMGRGSELNYLKERAKNLKLKNFIFKPSVPSEDVNNVLKEYDVCYLGLKAAPTFRYGVSPNKLFDYFYASRPIIYAIDSGKYDPISEYNAGLKCTPENAEELANCIKFFKNMDPLKREEMGENGHELLKNQYSYNELVKSLELVIEELSK